MRLQQQMIGILTPVRDFAIRIEEHDKRLGLELRRAGAEACMQFSESIHRNEFPRTNALEAALAEVRHVGVALRVAIALGYIASSEAHPVLCDLDRIAALLWHLIRGADPALVQHADPALVQRVTELSGPFSELRTNDVEPAPRHEGTPAIRRRGFG